MNHCWLLAAVLIAPAVGQLHAQVDREVETRVGLIEATKSPDRAMLFVSLNDRGNDFPDYHPDRGFLFELDNPSVVFPDLRWHGKAISVNKESLVLILEEADGTQRRVVFRAKSNTSELTPPLSALDTLITIRAMHRFNFPEPKTHAELVRVQLYRTLSDRHRVQ